ncbi:hypothetical protein ACP70R_003534 [Stipagrostis hirtigluma subsp. patula]
MAQASVSALLRRLRRHRDPAAALLRRRLLSSSPACSSPSALLEPSRLGGGGGSGSSSGLSASLGAHPRPRLPRRQHAAATAARAAHQAAASSGSAVATASSEAGTSTAASHPEIVEFIKSAFGKLEGQNHRWLNTTNGTWRTLNQEGIYLVLLYRSCETIKSISKHSAAFEKLKYLQQRYPRLNVLAVYHGSDISFLAAQSQVLRTVMKQYITFPILMSDKDFSNMTNGACYLLFEGSKDPLLFSKWDEEPEFMIKAIEELSALKAEPSENVLSRVSWQKEEAIKEPYVGSFRNLLLYHPACVSVDEDGDRIFISDSNHHRIIISNGNGMILDCIGSSPGLEDGEFESAKLLRPAASFYHATEDCLYIVDSENHAVRKADLGRRILETVYPVFNKSSGIWSWITDKLGLRKEVTSNIQDFDADSIAHPWHLLQISEDNLLVADRNFETTWILRISTGEKQDIRRREEVIESYQQIVNERCALLKDMGINWSSSAKEHSDSLEKTPNKELLSSVSRFQNCIVFCDTDGQRVFKHNLDTKNTSNIHFSNCEVLGLPYWFFCNLERVSTCGQSIGKSQEHTRQSEVLPGRCNITVCVDIPVHTELAAPLVESCIWRQVRGSGAEISGSDEPGKSTEKVGIAQQWYDELDNLAFSEAPEEPTAHGGDDKPADQSYQDQRRVKFTCVVNVSPGTAELVASAALYLKIDRTKDEHGDQKALVKKIIQCEHREEHAGVELLMEHCEDARDLVFMKPVHLRLRLDCADHPAGATNKETINTESSLKINISLD